jgi:hypothetical protein
MKIKLTRAIVLFFIAYILVTILAVATTETYAMVYKSPEPTPGMSILQAVAFVATVPYHVLIMLIIWPIFAWLYFRKPGQKNLALQSQETWQLSFLWLQLAVIVDLVGFVLIKSPYSLTPHEFYVIYQPWISLIYVAIFLSPLIRLGLARLAVKG